MDERARRVREQAHQPREQDGRPEGRQLDQGGKGEAKNEGEGNRTAAREYNSRTRRFIAKGEVEEKAREAREAIDGPEGSELRGAEKEGKRHSHGEDPALRK